MPAERFDFHNAEGLQLAALLDRPAARRARSRCLRLLLLWQSTTGPHGASPDGLKQHGIAVLRFDFTGLGGSEDEFADTTFSSNVDDLVAAADHLRQTLAAPSILIGHGLGRAAVLAAAHRPRSARGGDDQCPVRSRHVTGLLADGKAASGDEDTIGAFSHSLSNPARADP